jgi:oxygen-dependent protoporphyrinogen oxidase
VAEGPFALTVGSAAHPELVEADAVVLATPAAPTARLLADLAPVAAAELAAVEYASMAVVTLAFRAAELTSTGSDRLCGRRCSGFLVPPVDGRRIKAATFSFAKWAWVRDAGTWAPWTGRTCCSCAPRWAGTGEESALQATDEELVAASLADLAAAAGLPRHRSTPTCSAGAAGCRSTPSGTSTGSPGSAPTSPASPGWRCAGGVRRGRDPGRHRLAPGAAV